VVKGLKIENDSDQIFAAAAWRSSSSARLGR
jgi:hypothetical protein